MAPARRLRDLLLLCLVTAGPADSHAAAGPVRLRVDGSRVIGRIRPLHGVNNGPLASGGFVDVSPDYRALRIPFARLHDAEWPDPAVVDMHAVFPDPGADPLRAESYRFALTDDYVRAIAACGTGIVYRLGESIEHRPRKVWVHPPADPAAWADVALGIIRHYNEGWADGHHLAVRYWEIWNEPENRPAMWTGSDEDYYRLYVTASRRIRERYPSLKVGGPSVGATGPVVDGEWRPTPFLRGFFDRCRAREAPIDFFSWHTYAKDPSVYPRKAHAIRRWLDARGLRETEIHLNEWNLLPDDDWTPHTPAGQGLERERWFARIGGAEGAAFLVSVLVRLQDAPVDVANYYSGDTSPFGLFTRHGARRKTYLAMRAFATLLDTAERVEVRGGDATGQAVSLAGRDPTGSRWGVLLAACGSESGRYEIVVEGLPAGVPLRWEVLVLGETRSLEATAAGAGAGPGLSIPVELHAPGVALLRIRAGSEGRGP